MTEITQERLDEIHRRRDWSITLPEGSNQKALAIAINDLLDEIDLLRNAMLEGEAALVAAFDVLTDTALMGQASHAIARLRNPAIGNRPGRAV